jgi:hypothetical protein
MQHPQISPSQMLAPEERAFFLQLAALNVAFEAARAAPPGPDMATAAARIDDSLNRYFRALIEPVP